MSETPETDADVERITRKMHDEAMAILKNRPKLLERDIANGMAIERISTGEDGEIKVERVDPCDFYLSGEELAAEPVE